MLQRLEGALRQVEARLQRREQELAAAVEESRSAARMERARMVALHTQVSQSVSQSVSEILLGRSAELASELVI